MGRYAKETTVSVEKSKAEIEQCLVRYGATAFTNGWGEAHWLIAFRLKKLAVRFTLPKPDVKDRSITHKKNRSGWEEKRTDSQFQQAYDQDCRQRWRALLLVVKAKLEAVECGISTLEKEFMAFIVLPNDQTLGEWLVREHLEEIRAGKMPLALAAKKEEIIQDAELA